MKTIIRHIIITMIVLNVFFASSVETTFAATLPSATIDPAYSTVMYNSTFPVNVNIKNVPMTGMHCVKIILSVVNGGFGLSGSSTKTISHVNSATAVTYSVIAPSSGTVRGTISAKVTYSDQYSCGGTMIILNVPSVSIGAANPWKVEVQINTLCSVDWGQTSSATMVSYDSWRYKSTIVLKSPLVGTFNVPPSSGSYSLSATWWCKVGKSTLPKGKTMNVNITRSGMKFAFGD
jgi:hypothetical protein